MMLPPQKSSSVPRLRWRLALWALAALTASLTLAGVVRWRQRQIRAHWSVVQAGDWKQGSNLFFQEKGCGQCHSPAGASRLAASLGADGIPKSGLSHVITAMWNHAPKIWEGLASRQIRYPAINQQEMTHLLTFLYAEQCAGGPGNVESGRAVFKTMRCGSCHTASPQAKSVTLLWAAGEDTPARWAGVMWNHAIRLAPSVTGAGAPWPEFQGREMADLFAYVRESAGRADPAGGSIGQDPKRGWEVFQSRGCVACHSVLGKGGHGGPPLDPQRQEPLGLLSFTGLMWNHAPGMLGSLAAAQTAPPPLSGRDMADLAAFLLSLHYVEPAGSPLVGRTVFAERGCSRCHGAAATGSNLAPRLRGRSGTFTSSILAAALWQHGRAMHSKAVQMGIAWPILVETDVGNLLSFLNDPPE